MKYHSIYQKIGCTNAQDVFDYLIDNLNECIRNWDYFVDWGKVIGNTRDIEVDLNILNYLIGKVDIENEFAHILKKYPKIIKLIPVLLACRDDNFKILTGVTGEDLTCESFSFENGEDISEDRIKEAVRFAKETGLLNLFANKTIKNVVDYVIGVEVGLDSNARKNRGGTAMEKIVEAFIKRLCDGHGIQYISHATSERVRQMWGLHLGVDKTSRSFDFAISNQNSLYLIEVNYYGGGGSKLKSTAGEYKALHDFLAKGGHRFIWITDGLGWQSTKRPLEETFIHIDHLLNLRMLTEGLLEDIIVNNL